VIINKYVNAEIGGKKKAKVESRKAKTQSIKAERKEERGKRKEERGKGNRKEEKEEEKEGKTNYLRFKRFFQCKCHFWKWFRGGRL